MKTMSDGIRKKENGRSSKLVKEENDLYIRYERIEQCDHAYLFLVHVPKPASFFIHRLVKILIQIPHAPFTFHIHRHGLHETRRSTSRPTDIQGSGSLHPATKGQLFLDEQENHEKSLNSDQDFKFRAET